MKDFAVQTFVPVEAAVASAVERFGYLPVLAAVLRQVLPKRPAGPVARLEDLPDYLRRDVGLPPRDAARTHRLDRPLPWLL